MVLVLTEGYNAYFAGISPLPYRPGRQVRVRDALSKVETGAR
jgi:hypothetical protein